jgi:hypothetical protein
MAAGSTYTPIATYTVPTAQASYTFSSIPGTYTDLVLVLNAGCSGATEQDTYVVINGDTGSNYSQTYMAGDGSSASSGRASNVSDATIGYPIRPTLITTIICNFQNYSNSTTYKSWISKDASANSLMFTVVGLWRNTNAITSLLLKPSNGRDFLAGSTFTLYGIAAA